MEILRQYDEATTFQIPIPKVDDTDFSASGDWTPIAGDVQISKDGGAFTNITTLPVAVGNTWKFSLSATETQAKQIVVLVIDAALENQCIVISTYNHASAQHSDLNVALNDLSAAEVNTEVDTALIDYDPPTNAELIAALAALNDVSIADINTVVDTAVGTALTSYDAPTKAEMDAGFAALNDITVQDIIDGIVEGSLKLDQMLRIILAGVAGKSTDSGTKFRDQADTKDRISSTVDTAGNRTAVTVDGD